MTTLNLKVEDSLVDVIKTMLVGFVQDKRIEITEEKNSLIDEVVVNSIEEVQKRVSEAEMQEGMSEEEYEKYMDDFFQNELGIKR